MFASLLSMHTNSKWAKSLTIFILLCTMPSSANEPTPATKSLRARHGIYVPEQREYGLELGSMWEDGHLYWLGGHVGYHLGGCLFSQSPTCQQYVDAIGGAGGRDGLTIGTALMGLRWQFVKRSSTFSPQVRLLAGASNIRDNQRNRTVGTGALAYGWTMAVHERLNLLVEARAGYSDEFWVQSFMGVNFNMDRDKKVPAPIGAGGNQ